MPQHRAPRSCSALQFAHWPLSNRNVGVTTSTSLSRSRRTHAQACPSSRCRGRGQADEPEPGRGLSDRVHDRALCRAEYTMGLVRRPQARPSPLAPERELWQAPDQSLHRACGHGLRPVNARSPRRTISLLTPYWHRRCAAWSISSFRCASMIPRRPRSRVLSKTGTRSRSCPPRGQDQDRGLGPTLCHARIPCA